MMRTRIVWLTVLAWVCSQAPGLAWGSGFSHTTADLSQARTLLAGTGAGDLALFGGGTRGFQSGQASDVVDVYDGRTGNWSVEHLSVARFGLAATSVGTKAIFAGGASEYSGGCSLRVYSDAVDIYDTDARTWLQAALSQPRTWLSAASVGSKALFAGGEYSGGGFVGSLYVSDVVDIYDAAMDRWSTGRLSQARSAPAAASAGGKAIFAGGLYREDELRGPDLVSDVVDIYDPKQDAWSTTSLPVPCVDLAAASVGSKAIFGGGLTWSDGYYPSDLLQIYDVTTDTWTTATFPNPRTGMVAATVAGRALFAGGVSSPHGERSDLVSIYDPSSNTWATMKLSEARWGTAVAGVGNKAVFAGGHAEDYHVFSVADVFQTPTVAGDASLDGWVDDDDLSILPAQWTGAGGSGGTWKTGDFDGNGAVSDVDLSLLLANWTGDSGSAGIPEPVTLILLALGAQITIWPRRKKEMKR